MTVTFFGHRDAPQALRLSLKKIICDLIEKEGADLFYVGNHGNFDALARGILEELRSVYHTFRYVVVLAYLPTKEERFEYDTVYPETVAAAPPRFAIERRNRYMIAKSNAVITYIRYKGGAAKWGAVAKRKGLRIFEL